MLRRLIIAVIMAAASATTVRAAVIYPVSQRLHAQAQATAMDQVPIYDQDPSQGPISWETLPVTSEDHPADLSIGPVYGSHTHHAGASVSAVWGATGADITASSNIVQDSIEMRASATGGYVVSSISLGAGGSADVTATIDLLAPTGMMLNFAYTDCYGSSINILRDGKVVWSPPHSWSQDTPISTAFTFEPGRYDITLHFNSGVTNQGHEQNFVGGSATFTMTVPEPASLALLALAPLALLRRRRS